MMLKPKPEHWLQRRRQKNGVGGGQALTWGALPLSSLPLSWGQILFRGGQAPHWRRG